MAPISAAPPTLCSPWLLGFWKAVTEVCGRFMKTRSGSSLILGGFFWITWGFCSPSSCIFKWHRKESERRTCECGFSSENEILIDIYHITILSKWTCCWRSVMWVHQSYFSKLSSELSKNVLYAAPARECRAGTPEQAFGKELPAIKGIF